MKIKWNTLAMITGLALLTSGAFAQNISDGTYYSTDKKIMKVEVTGYGQTNLKFKNIISARTLQNPLATKEETDLFRILDEDDQKNYYYHSRNRSTKAIFLQEESTIAVFELKEGDGSLDARITMTKLYGQDKKGMKGKSPSAYKAAVIAYEEALLKRMNATVVNEEYQIALNQADGDFKYEQWTSAIKKYEALLEIKPDETYPKEQINKCKEALAKNDAAREAEIDARRLPTTSTHNAKFEAECLKVLQHTAKNSNWKEQFNKIILQSAEWSVVRNKYTGILLYRTKNIIAVASWPDGHCSYQYFTMAQDADGAGGFTSTYNRAIGQQTTIRCEHAK